DQVAAESAGGRAQRAARQPGDSDVPGATGVGDLDQARGRGAAAVGWPGGMCRGQQRDPESGGYQAAQGLDVLAFEADDGSEPGLAAEALGDRPKAVAGPQHDEHVVPELGEGGPFPAGERVAGRDGEAERLGGPTPPTEGRPPP